MNTETANKWLDVMKLDGKVEEVTTKTVWTYTIIKELIEDNVKLEWRIKALEKQMKTIKS